MRSLACLVEEAIAEWVHRIFRLDRYAAIALALGLFWSSATFAQTQVSDASDYVRTLGGDVIAVLKKKELDKADRKKLLHAIFTRTFDWNVSARFALGRYWRKATADDKVRYLKIFPSYLANIYAGQLIDYSGEVFLVLSERPLGKNTTLVNAMIRRPDNSSLSIDFRVRKGPEGFKNVDIMIERLSMLVTKREEFSSVIRREGIEGLLTRLESQPK